MRLCVRQRKGDAWESADDGELYLQLPEHTAGGERVDASTPLADGDIRSRAQPDQSLESSCHWEQKVSDKHDSSLTHCPKNFIGFELLVFLSAFSHFISI